MPTRPTTRVARARAPAPEGSGRVLALDGRRDKLIVEHLNLQIVEVVHRARPAREALKVPRDPTRPCS